MSLPLEDLGSLPFFKKLTDVPKDYYPKIQKQKELALKRLKAVWEEEDFDLLLGQIAQWVLDKRNEYTDKDGYTWKWEHADISTKDFARGIIVARKDSNPEWFKFYDGRKIYRWEGGSVEPYSPEELSVFRTAPPGTWERLRDEYLGYLKDKLVETICNGDIVPSNMKTRGEEVCVFHWNGFFSMGRKLYRDEETGDVYDSYYENSIGVTDLVKDDTVYSRVAEFYKDKGSVRFDTYGRTLDVYIVLSHNQYDTSDSDQDSVQAELAEDSE